MKLVWDAIGEHFYETGINQGVLYPKSDAGLYPEGFAWNGLTAVTEKPSGAESTKIYANNAKYLTLISAEEFGGTIEAYTYPDAWYACDGSIDLDGVVLGQQPRKSFGLCYRTIIGNDSLGESYGYKLHLVYGATATPSERNYQTINDNPEATALSWEFDTIPVNVNRSNTKPVSCITIDSKKVDEDALAELEKILYGFDAPEFDATNTYEVGDIVTHTVSDVAKTYICKTKIATPAAWDASKWEETTLSGPRLPLPDEVIAMFES